MRKKPSQKSKGIEVCGFQSLCDLRRPTTHPHTKSEPTERSRTTQSRLWKAGVLQFSSSSSSSSQLQYFIFSQCSLCKQRVVNKVDFAVFEIVKFVLFLLVCLLTTFPFWQSLRTFCSDCFMFFIFSDASKLEIVFPYIYRYATVNYTLLT